jgi:4-amino-4-deoxy-L-arabinose transferase-like glycosyltransferase
VVSAILSTAAVGGVAALAWLLFDQRTAVVAAALAAVYPEAISLGAFVLSEAPFVPLMMLNLVFWTIAWQQAEKSKNQRTKEPKGRAYGRDGDSLVARRRSGGGAGELMRPELVVVCAVAV